MCPQQVWHTAIPPDLCRPFWASMILPAAGGGVATFLLPCASIRSFTLCLLPGAAAGPPGCCLPRVLSLGWLSEAALLFCPLWANAGLPTLGCFDRRGPIEGTPSGVCLKGGPLPLPHLCWLLGASMMPLACTMCNRTLRGGWLCGALLAALRFHTVLQCTVWGWQRVGGWPTTACNTTTPTGNRCGLVLCTHTP